MRLGVTTSATKSQLMHERHQGSFDRNREIDSSHPGKALLSLSLVSLYIIIASEETSHREQIVLVLWRLVV